MFYALAWGVLLRAQRRAIGNKVYDSAVAESVVGHNRLSQSLHYRLLHSGLGRDPINHYSIERPVRDQPID